MAARHSTWTLSYRERAAHPSIGPLAQYLLRLISIKKTNLCLSADVETSAELIALADEVGDSICILKTHCDIVTDWTERTAKALRTLAQKKYFVIFEDRKFADIGGTVQKQYTSGYHRIANWAEITNAHILPGPAIVTALHQAATQTIQKYNTTVHTEISASPPPSIANGDDGDNNNNHNGGDDDGDDNDDQVDNEVAVESPPEMEGADDRRLSIKPMDRKHSVVSISTTISTRTESISPRPQPDFHPDEVFALDTPTLLSRLGEPPFLRSLLLLAEMSSAGHLLTPEYSRKCVDIARQNREFVMGFIAQRSLNTEPEDNFLTMTPGCQLPPPGQEGKKLGDGLGQQYNTPKSLIYDKGCDVIIVGRGIVNAPNRRAEAARYRSEGWKAYEERIGVKKG
ncbi:orotidine-5'-phosphate decarboxylase [Lindgomyces ingoldianus]|uniref:Orotidine-5'-phosphate decarboxylase n=1 Tax=Lindgomyces ingoldianus TaxID=673940 RepID=A0ACB6QS57_9PLEO|nr:orotidine-5'-phosphate decarboxylase [Lindgomyces ingoldianus]KAF2469771.1 orotidine-5'-phosphate decarboxylase [Lindgomyces ingoldianus]